MINKENEKNIELKKKVKTNQEIVEEFNIDYSKVRFAIHRFKTKQPDLFCSTCGEFLIQTNGPVRRDSVLADAKIGIGTRRKKYN